MHTPSHRKSLNKDQKEVLRLLYKFRYVTAQLIAEYFHKPKADNVYKRLTILYEQGLIGKKYDSSYRILGIPAAYYLTSKGMSILNQDRIQERKEPYNIRRINRDKLASIHFINMWLDTFRAYLCLRSSYGAELQFITSNQLHKRYDYFEDFTPHAYVQLNGRHCILEYISANKPYSVIQQRLTTLANFIDDESWDGIWQEFPSLVFLCENSAIEKRTLKQAKKALSEILDLPDIYFTSAKAVTNGSTLVLTSLHNEDLTSFSSVLSQ